MLGLGRILGLAVTVVCGLATSQAPEFAQQYRQRLNGALDELTRVVETFDANAKGNNLTRQRALEAYEKTGSAFFQERAEAVKMAIGRSDDLERQSRNFDAAPPVLRPVVVMRSPDGSILKGTLEDYEPAVPLTLPGWIWAGCGLLFGFSLSWLTGYFLRPKPGYPDRDYRV